MEDNLERLVEVHKFTRPVLWPRSSTDRIEVS